MISLLSPAKSLDFEFSMEGLECTTPDLLENADYLAKKLKPYSAGRIAKLMSVSKDLAELNHNRYQSWHVPHDSSARPCLLAFRGDVYRGMAAVDFTRQDLDFAQDHIRILSGLYGVLRPMDRILPYRLEMGTSLKVTATKKNLYNFWGETITNKLNEVVEQNDSKVMVNLASNEYFKSIHTDKLKGELITCSFKDKKNGEYKAIMTFAKLARGFMTRYIVSNRVDQKEGLKDFDLEGYGFSSKLSTPTEYVFTRG